MPIVYIRLLDEGVDVWRPVEVEAVGQNFRITGNAADDEKWEFKPGEVVRCETRMLTLKAEEAQPALVAVERVSGRT